MSYVPYASPLTALEHPKGKLLVYGTEHVLGKEKYAR
jgi:hypothetical protein